MDVIQKENLVRHDQLQHIHGRVLYKRGSEKRLCQHIRLRNSFYRLVNLTLRDPVKHYIKEYKLLFNV